MVFRQCRQAASTGRARLVERSGPASVSDGGRLVSGTASYWGCLWGLKDLILHCVDLQSTTVARLWQQSTLTNTSFSCGEQIVSTLVLSNVCLSFIGAAHEKSFRRHGHARGDITPYFLLLGGRVCSTMLKRVTWQNHLCLRACTWQRPFYVCGVRVCVWACVPVRACRFTCQIECAHDHVCSVFDDGAALYGRFPREWS